MAAKIDVAIDEDEESTNSVTNTQSATHSNGARIDTRNSDGDTPPPHSITAAINHRTQSSLPSLGTQSPLPSLGTQSPLPSLGTRLRSNTIDGIIRVKAGEGAKETATGLLLKYFERSPEFKFVFAVNNMTDHDLRRKASSGSDSWPFETIKKNECKAALFGHSQFENLNAVFTADNDKHGIRTVMLYAHWTKQGRGIGIYAGMTEAISKKINRKEKIHDHELNGNKATIINPGSCYVFGYDVKELEFAQFAVTAGDEAVAEAIRKFTTFCTGSMPRFTFVVNNLTGYQLILAEDHKVQGSWPLGNIKKGECAVAGFDKLNMSLAARYTATIEDQQKVSISLAGSWPIMGSRKIFIGEGMKATDAWKKLNEDSQNWSKSNRKAVDDKQSSAYIEVKNGISGKTSCVYVFVLRLSDQ